MKKDKNRITGFILIASGFLIFWLRPFQNCKWYDVGCKLVGTTLTPIFIIAMIILIFFGIKKLIK